MKSRIALLVKRKVVIQAILGAFAVIASIFSIQVFAAPGELDSGFGDGKGWANTEFVLSQGTDYAASSLLQSDGKILAIGFNGSVGLALARFHSNGIPDLTFGNSGQANVFLDAPLMAKSGFEQGDGKILIVGSSFAEGNPLAFVQVNQDGSLDTEFSTEGTVEHSLDFSALSVIQQVDGKIIVAGKNNDGEVVVSRYQSDGSQDLTFGFEGITKTNLNIDSFSDVSIIQRLNGNLLVSANTSTSSFNRAVMVAYNSDGSLDLSFSEDGKLFVDAIVGVDIANDLIEQPDGKILLVGQKNNGNDQDFALVRYDAEGAIDESFGDNGLVLTDFNGENDQIESIVLASDGKIIVSGGSDGVLNKISLVRYLQDGSLDESFSSDGKEVSSLQVSFLPVPIILQNDNKVIVLDSIARESSVNGMDLVISRYSTNGNIDTSFGSNGIVKTHFLYSIIDWLEFAQQENNMIVSAGVSDSGDDYHEFVLSRHDVNGDLDLSFADQGKFVSDINDGFVRLGNIQQTPGNGTLLCGASGGPQAGRFVLIKLLENGSFNSSFGLGGIVKTDFPGENGGIIHCSVLPNGKILAIGGSKVLRYHEDGSVDESFANQGVFLKDGSGGKVLEQADGLLLIEEEIEINGGQERVLKRYHNDMSLDQSFGNAGAVRYVDYGLLSSVYAEYFFQQADGKIVIALDNATDVYIIRLNPDGSADPSFGSNGVASVLNTLSIDLRGSPGIVQQADGKLLIAVRFVDGDSSYPKGGAVLRINQNGSLDTSFGDGGAKSLDADIHSLIYQADHKIVAGGRKSSENGYAFFIARMLSELTDTDNDGVADLDDDCNATESLSSDNDGDGCDDATEDEDDDNDGMPDFWEIQHGLNPLVFDAYEDSDSDTLQNITEYQLGTHPNDADSDGDGVLDNVDNCKTTLSVNSDNDLDGCDDVTEDEDDDNDGMPDDWEVQHGLNPLLDDSQENPDGDDFPNLNEFWRGSDPNFADPSQGEFGGILDPTFNGQGYLISEEDGTESIALQQPDGKILLINYIASQEAIQFSKYFLNGVLDTDFGVDGFVTQEISISTLSFRNVLQTTDGKIVMVGYDDGAVQDVLYRFNPGGSKDMTFGVNGMVAINAGGLKPKITSLSAQTDGKLLLAGRILAGQVDGNDNFDFVLLRYNNDGNIDSGFGVNGLVQTDTGNNHDNAWGVKELEDGKIVVGGHGGENVIVVAPVVIQYLNDGSIDSSFGINGIAQITSESTVYDMLVQPDQKIIIIGLRFFPTRSWGVWRLNSTGELDSTFSGNGEVLLGELGQNPLSGLLAPDGSIFIAGDFYGAGGQYLGLLSIKDDGSVNTSFGDDGVVIFEEQNTMPMVNMIQQTDGKLLLASKSLDSIEKILLIRIFSGFELDTDEDNYPDEIDVFPFDPGEWLDLDGDGTGNNADWDDDNDGVPDSVDAEPLNGAVFTEIPLPLGAEYRGGQVDNRVLH